MLPQDIFLVAQTMQSQQNKKIFYDLIAAEYARKIQPSLGQLPNSNLTLA